MSKMSTVDPHFKEQLLSPRELKEKLKVTPERVAFIRESRQQIKDILDGKDSRLILIVGPCSIHDTVAAKEYATKLRQLSETISSSFFVVMRAYFEKPRTKLGWKGILNDPYLNGTNDIATGLHLSRELLLFLADLGVPAATEILDPTTASYLGDLISWACIGARTSESQIHRQCASGLNMPVAFKNSTSGNLDVAINGVLSAACPHHHLGIDESGHISTIETKGNLYAHIALRGGQTKPNYDEASIASATELLKNNGLEERVIIDCSHDNSMRRGNEQEHVFRSIIEQSISGNAAIKGVALESFLSAGCQPLMEDPSLLRHGISITDPCMGWAMTEDLLLWGKDVLEKASTDTQISSISEETVALAHCQTSI